MINMSNQLGHSEIYFFFFSFFCQELVFFYPQKQRKKEIKIKMYQFHSLFSFLSLFLDQKPKNIANASGWVLPTTSICYIWYPPSLNNHKELGVAIHFVVQRNMYVCLMERYFIFCKNDFGLSNIFDPAQSKVSDPAKNARKPIIYCVLVKIFLRTNLIYI